MPIEFAKEWLRGRLFEQRPKTILVPVAPTREYCLALFKAKIEATIRNVGDMIGWEDDNETVSIVAYEAKQSLLRFMPHMLPRDDDQASLYRLVLQHGDFGIHNMSIDFDEDNKPDVTSVYDWETGCIVPALLSDTTISIYPVDLGTDDNGKPTARRIPRDATGNYGRIDGLVEILPSGKFCSKQVRWLLMWSLQALFTQAPDYEGLIQPGEDARHLWFALRDWRGGNADVFFDDLGAWAESRMQVISTFAAAVSDAATAPNGL